MSTQFSVEPISRPERPAGGVRRECGCADRRWRSHHDRLLHVETDTDELLELLELAVTWTELDYSAAAVLPPEHWSEFAHAHDWRNPDRMERLFGLAADIALRPATGPARGAAGLHLLDLAAAGGR